ncbi:MAG: FMN-binding protein [Anaerotruncus rubiinfantis]|jgi:major membrane immunogen (membrane-anchored lipoprotein)|uniref:FMN-binding protein n=1 Tax=Anaerotruncus rubiinfantis TaxID=1720200 RepID=UPI00189A7E3E|nr:FMN-binding protein [Anaerotruncus rubiinfantis]
MKKILSLLLAAALVAASFSACKRETEPVEPPSSSSEPEPVYVYQDGEYSVSYAVPAIDRTLDYLTISVKDDEITIEEYGMKEDPGPASQAGDSSASGEAVSTPASSASSSAESTGSASADSSSQALTTAEAEALEAAQLILEEYNGVRGNLDKMEPIKDQEEHTYRFIRMMRTALESAEAGDQKSVTLGKYADGTYKSTMPDFNSDGWKEYVELTVKDGLIDTITYDAIGKDDPASRITTDTSLNSGSQGPSYYYPQIVTNFIEAGDDLTKVMSPTNGASATKSFGKLMNPLLANMISGGEKEIIAPRYVNGTYRAQFTDFDENGWKDYVVIRIDSDKVTIKEFDAISKVDETKLKSQDTELAAKQKEKTDMTPEKAFDALEKNWNGADNDVTKVENVAGATVSSNNFKLLVGQILATAALEGDNEATLEVERIASTPAK